MKAARNAVQAVDHTMENIFVSAGIATEPKELTDSFSPNYLNSPGLQTTCKWQPSPSIDGIVDAMNLYFGMRNGGTDSIGITNHFLLVNFLSCVVNGQEIVRYSGEEMSLIYQEHLLRAHGKAGDDERAVIRTLMKEIDFARFRKTSPTAGDGYPSIVVSPSETETFCIPLHVIFKSLFSKLYLNSSQRKAFNFQQIEFVLGFQPSTGTNKDSLFARNIDNSANPCYGASTTFSDIRIITQYRERLDKRLVKPVVDYAILPKWEIAVKYGVDLGAANKSYQFKLSDVVNRKNVDAMYIYWRMPATSFQSRNGYGVHNGTVANDTQIIGSLLPINLQAKKVGSNDPVYVRGKGCARPITHIADMLDYVSGTFKKKFGSLLPASMESGQSDMNGWCPYMLMWDFVGLEGDAFTDIIGGANSNSDDWTFTLTAQEAISANLELHIALRYKTGWKLSGRIPVETPL